MRMVLGAQVWEPNRYFCYSNVQHISTSLNTEKVTWHEKFKGKSSENVTDVTTLTELDSPDKGVDES